MSASHEAESVRRYFDHPRPEVVALVPAGVRQVVDVGCASGALGAALKAARPEVEVRGIEHAPEPAARAREVLDDVWVGDADALPAGWPTPDCVIFADVLEHVRDPWRVLADWRGRLAPGGHVVISIPNVAHRTIVGGLLRGRFDYASAGILDRDHVRFFTRRSATALLEGAGFELVDFGRVTGPATSRGVWRWANRRLQGVGRGPLATLADPLTMQFLLVGRRA